MNNIQWTNKKTYVSTSHQSRHFTIFFCLCTHGELSVFLALILCIWGHITPVKVKLVMTLTGNDSSSDFTVMANNEPTFTRHWKHYDVHLICQLGSIVDMHVIPQCWHCNVGGLFSSLDTYLCVLAERKCSKAASTKWRPQLFCSGYHISTVNKPQYCLQVETLELCERHKALWLQE